MATIKLPDAIGDAVGAANTVRQVSDTGGFERIDNEDTLPAGARPVAQEGGFERIEPKKPKDLHWFSGDPKKMTEAFLEPFTRWPEAYTKVREEAQEEIAHGWEALFKDRTMFGKAWGALQLLGGVGRFTATPIEALGRTVAGKPVGDILEKVTGVPEVSERTEKFVGDSVSIGAQFFGLDPVAAAAKVALPEEKISRSVRDIAAKTYLSEQGITDPISALHAGIEKFRAGPVGKDIEGVLSPTTLSPSSKYMAEVIRSWNGELAATNTRASEQLEAFRGQVNRLPDAERLAFIHAIETKDGRLALPPDVRPLADELRMMLDEARDRVKSLKIPGLLEKVYEDFFPHYWQNPRPTLTRSLEDEIARARGKGPVEGAQTFRKKRTYMTTKEGMEAGLKPVSTDPIELTLLKIRELNKFYYGTQMVREIKATGPVAFVRAGEHAPHGWVQLMDAAFRAVLPPAVVEHFNSFDTSVRAGLEKVARTIGINIKQPLTDPKLTGGTLGYTKEGWPNVVSRFGNDETVLMHEIGHQLDFRYSLAERMAHDPQAWGELAQLAHLRSPGGVATGAYKDYIESGTERIANLIHAYWHAPELLKVVAPAAYKRLTQYAAFNREFGEILNMVKPSVAIKPEVVLEHIPGWREMGKYYAPPEAARVFNNYVQGSALAGKSATYDALRSAANAVNSAQLSLSAFHATFTTFDTMISKTALGLEQAFKGEFGKAAANLAKGILPTTAIETVMKGNRVRAAYLNPASATPEMRRIIQGLEKGGGRINMDWFYRNTEGSGLIKSIRDGSLVRQVLDAYPQAPIKTLLKLPFQIAGKALQDVSHPIMEWLVPRQKLGVFYDLANDWLKNNPKATEHELRNAMQIIWNSVDNRLGQLVYDNLFWSKTQKDLAFLAARSVGWNLGTVRELGGAMFDASRAIAALRAGDEIEFTHRMAYAVAMPMVLGTWGALINYLYTGEGPKEMRDYFFPRTGRINEHGQPERVMMPGYIKDVLEYNEAPVQTVANKLNPLWAFALQLYSNQDFYGGIIRDPEAEPSEQAKQFAEYVARQFQPFSFRSLERMRKQDTPILQQIGAFLGFQNAPQRIVDPERTHGFERLHELRAIRKRQRMEEQ